MAVRTKHIEGIGDVSFQKRRGVRNIKLRMDAHGRAVVTMPYFVPYALGEQFVRRNQSWLEMQQSRHEPLIDGQMVGRIHKLRFMYDAEVKTPRARVLASRIDVRHAGDPGDEAVQTTARKAAVRALRREGERFLPKRLQDIARVEGYEYVSCQLKQLKGRWGSCDSRGHIVLNVYLMQLPDELIDYVIYHELAHTRHMNHGEGFWQELTGHLPSARELRKRIKQYQPTVPARPAGLATVSAIK